VRQELDARLPFERRFLDQFTNNNLEDLKSRLSHEKLENSDGSGFKNNMWFAANLFFKSQRENNVDAGPLWEEQIILIEATNEAMARQKAGRQGKAQEIEYRNQTGKRVRWSFEQMAGLYKIETDALKDGTELFSRFLKNSEVGSMLPPFED
jgi:hypothetical protein